MGRARGLDVPWLVEAAAAVAGGAQTLALVAAAEEPAIAHHSARTHRYAAALAAREGLTGLDAGVLFHACLLHDVGASALLTGAERFEVGGADLAATALAAHGYTAEQRQEVWQAVALHTSPHIAERMGPVTRLVRLGVRADFGDDLVDAALRAEVERELPRLDVERVLSRVVVEQALAEPGRAPGVSWPAALLAAHRASPHPDARLTAF